MDKYDEAIELLTQNPFGIPGAWMFPSDSVCGSLFKFCGRDKFGDYGCLTQVKAGTDIAETSELTEAIRADDRIPDHPSKITVNDLHVFAEWQRRIDKELGRVT